MATFTVHPIAAERLARIRTSGRDEHGNPLGTSHAEGWEPVRCCLRIATAGESVALISYTPFSAGSVWAETGPVFIHANECDGYPARDRLPAQLRTGPRILRPYDQTGGIAYDHIEAVPDGEDIEPALLKLLGEPVVSVVHVRALLAQCFTYAVSR